MGYRVSFWCLNSSYFPQVEEVTICKPMIAESMFPREIGPYRWQEALYGVDRLAKNSRIEKEYNSGAKERWKGVFFFF